MQLLAKIATTQNRILAITSSIGNCQSDVSAHLVWSLTVYVTAYYKS